MAYDITADIRLDPRLKAILAGIPAESQGDVRSRETLLAEANSDEARKQAELFRSFMDMCDSEEAAPSAGLRVHTEKVVSAPDRNTINLQLIRPDNDETLACVYYIHGGAVVLRRHVPGLGKDHRGQRSGRRDGRLPQLASGVVSSRSSSVPSRSQ